MPKAEELDKAGVLLIEAPRDLQKIADGFGPEQGRRATSEQAVYGMLADLAGRLGQIGASLAKVGTQLRTAAAELEAGDES